MREERQYMEKHFFKKELEAMFRFHKTVLLVILKTIGGVLRYGSWLLPWIFLAACAWKPMLSGWRLFTEGVTAPAQAGQQTTPSYDVVASQVRSLPLETIQSRVDSGVRSFERISRPIRRK
jgi:hypothetical protein